MQVFTHRLKDLTSMGLKFYQMESESTDLADIYKIPLSRSKTWSSTNQRTRPNNGWKLTTDMRRITKKKYPMDISRRSKPHKKDHESWRNLVIGYLTSLVLAPDHRHLGSKQICFWQERLWVSKAMVYIEVIDLLEEPFQNLTKRRVWRSTAIYLLLTMWKMLLVFLTFWL